MSKVHRLGKVLDRCNLLAGASDDNSSPHTPHNYNHSCENELSNTNNQKPEYTPLSASYGYGYDDDEKPKTRGRVSYGKIIETDPLFRMAWGEWNVYKGALINRIKKIGVTAGRRICGMVERIPDTYFSGAQPVRVQRGAYLMQCLKSYDPNHDDWRYDENRREGRR
jgi:hypothetical protein